jgi:hypothetical protein
MPFTSKNWWLCALLVAISGSATFAQTPYPCTISPTNQTCLTLGLTQVPQGWIVGEVKQFAFGADSADLLQQLAAAGWVECAGQSLIRKDFDELWKIVGVSWGSADGTQSSGSVFYLPDLRSLFVRGWNHGKKPPSGYGNSPYKGDTDARVTPRPEAGDTGSAGATGDHVGSMQPDQLAKHRHWVAYVTGIAGGAPGFEYTSNGSFASQSHYTDDKGSELNNGGYGDQTHPGNAYLLYMIYIGKAATFVPFEESVSRDESNPKKKALYRNGWVDCLEGGCTSHKASATKTKP